jgi:hypothetical protein
MRKHEKFIGAIKKARTATPESARAMHSPRRVTLLAGIPRVLEEVRFLDLPRRGAPRVPALYDRFLIASAHFMLAR